MLFRSSASPDVKEDLSPSHLEHFRPAIMLLIGNDEREVGPRFLRVFQHFLFWLCVSFWLLAAGVCSRLERGDGEKGEQNSFPRVFGSASVCFRPRSLRMRRIRGSPALGCTFSFSPSGRERALAQQTFAAVFRQHELLLQVELMRVSIRVATGVFSFVFREDVSLVSAPTSQRKLGPSRAVWVAVLNIALILAEYLSASSSVMADDGKE